MVEDLPEMGAALKAIRKDPGPIINRYINGESLRSIAAAVGIDRTSVKRILLENSVHVRLRDFRRNEPEPTRKIYLPPRVPKIQPGEKVRFRHGNFRFLSLIECSGGKLWLFENLRGGWRESFTRYQIVDEYVGKEESE
jgi:hypothetical protein